MIVHLCYDGLHLEMFTRIVSFHSGFFLVCGHLAPSWETLTMALSVWDPMLASFVRPDSFNDTTLMGFLFVALTLLLYVALLILKM